MSRTDRVEIDQGSLAQARTTPEGFLVVDAYFYRSGVQTYDMGDGKVQREYRAPEDVFSAETLRAHALLPYIDEHVDEVNPDNARQLIRGMTGQDVRRDGDRARGTIIIYDADMIAKVRAGKREVSVGYRCALDPTPGVDPKTGERYDVRQLHHKPNHLAGTYRGRAGNAVIRVDHADQVTDSAASAAGGSMTPEELKKALEAAEAKLALEKKRADSAEAELLTVGRELRETKDKLGTLEKIRADDAGKSRAATKARIALDRVAMGVLPELYESGDKRRDGAGALGECRADSMDDRAIMVAVVEKVDGDKIPAERSDDYVRGAYEAAAKRAARSRDEFVRLDDRRATSLGREDEEDRPRRRDEDERARRDDDYLTNGDAAYERYERSGMGRSIYNQDRGGVDARRGDRN